MKAVVTATKSKPRGITDDNSLRTAKVGSHTWYYSLEGGKAVIGREFVRNGIKRLGYAVEPNTDEHIVIPSKLDGYKVTKIGKYAFGVCKNMKSISIPDKKLPLLASSLFIILLDGFMLIVDKLLLFLMNDFILFGVLKSKNKDCR